MKKNLVALMLALSSLAYAHSASAAVINSADIGGFKTFKDTNTGWVWMDLNNFFNKNTADMVNAANNAGFKFANKTEVETLLNSLPLNNGEWASYNNIMGGAPNRDLIWGAYDNGSKTAIGWAYSYSNEYNWNIIDNVGFSYFDIPNENSDAADMNIWAYNPVPEPTSVLLGLMSLGGLFGLKKRQLG